MVLTLEVYKNIKEVGRQLIKNYEEQNMIEELEDTFNFSIDEIENMFNKIEENVFLLKRIMPILYNLEMI